MSVDRRQPSDDYQGRCGLPIPQAALVSLIVLATVNPIGVVFAAGLEPVAYVDSRPAMTTEMVAIFSSLLDCAGWPQPKPAASYRPDDAAELIATT